MTKSILIIGGTGAQGSVVVQHLASTGLYELKCITRDTESPQAKELVAIPHVSLVAGDYDQDVLAEAIKGMDYVWVNTNGFAMGEQAETYWGIRIFQLSVRAGVKHLVYSGLDSAYRRSGYDPDLRIGHFEGKARVSEWMSAQPKTPMAWTVVDSGPYMETMHEIFAPRQDENRTYNFYIPMGSGAMPMIDLGDLARYVDWAYQNPERSNGLRLGISSANVSGEDMAKSFTAVTGKPAKYVDIPIDMWLEKAFATLPNGPNTKVGYRTAHDTALIQTYAENFTHWFNLYKAAAKNPGLLGKDYALLDNILPDRVRSIEEWMKKVVYTGEQKNVLKDQAERKLQT